MGSNLYHWTDRFHLVLINMSKKRSMKSDEVQSICSCFLFRASFRLLVVIQWLEQILLCLFESSTKIGDTNCWTLITGLDQSHSQGVVTLICTIFTAATRHLDPIYYGRNRVALLSSDTILSKNKMCAQSNGHWLISSTVKWSRAIQQCGQAVKVTVKISFQLVIRCL